MFFVPVYLAVYSWDRRNHVATQVLYILDGSTSTIKMKLNESTSCDKKYEYDAIKVYNFVWGRLLIQWLTLHCLITGKN